MLRGSVGRIYIGRPLSQVHAGDYRPAGESLQLGCMVDRLRLVGHVESAASGRHIRRLRRNNTGFTCNR